MEVDSTEFQQVLMQCQNAESVLLNIVGKVSGPWGSSYSTWNNALADVPVADRVRVEKVRNYWQLTTLAILDYALGGQSVPMPMEAYLEARAAAEQTARTVSQDVYLQALTDTLTQLRQWYEAAR